MHDTLFLKDAKQLLENVREGALATLDRDQPFVSSVGFLYRGDADGKFGLLYFLLSDLAKHTRLIKNNPHVSFLAVENNPELSVHEKKRVTVTGQMNVLENNDTAADLKKSYLKAFPKAEIFFTLTDFKFYVLCPSEFHWVGGFGKAGIIT